MVELVSSQTAKIAKEKGFKNSSSEYVYSERDDFTDPCILTEAVIEDGEYCAAPSQTELQKWLREKHDIHILITPFFVKENEELGIKERTEYRWNIWRKGIDYVSPASPIYKNYELALENGLRIALDLIQLNNNSTIAES